MKDETFPLNILNERSRWDLIAQIKDYSPALQSLEDDELYRLLFEIPNSLSIGKGFRDPAELSSQFNDRAIDSSVVKNYTQMVVDGTEFDPVFVRDEEFVDGGHRVQAYVNAKKSLIPVINLSPLYRIDWQDWLDNP